jgi:tRNA dimethylallyltransferase
MSKPVLIAGPTASGKSALALELASKAPSAIINADALQVYDGWRVLSARPSEADEAQAPHRLYGHVPMATRYSVGAWLREVESELRRAEKDGARPLIVGGTGLYFTALTEGLAEIPSVPEAIRDQANALRAEGGTSGFISYLQAHDPDILARIDQQNPMRLQRAYEVHAATGRALSAWQSETTDPLLPLDECIPVVLSAEPEWLNARIENRFDAMMDQGAIEEVQVQLGQGIDWSWPSAQALGAREIAAYLNGQSTRDDAVRDASVATRQFAKRQRSWFRNRMKGWHVLKVDEGDPKARLADLTDLSESGPQ